MASTLYIPKPNPVVFYEANPQQFAAYRSRHMSDYPYRKSRLWHLEPVEYYQKWQTSDVIRIQVESDFSPLQLELVNDQGYAVVTLVADNSTRYPHAFLPGLFAYEFTLSLGAVEPGCYFLRLSNGVLSELHLISEPQSIKHEHGDTLLFEYRWKAPVEDSYFEDMIYATGIRPAIRIEGAFGFAEPGANIQAYMDQKANPHILSAKTFETQYLTVGGSFGLPDWMIQKFNLIWAHNEVFVDGKQFARAGEAEISYQGVDGYPMRAATIRVQPGVNRGSKVFNPDVNTDIQLLVAHNIINTRLFGDISENAASNLIPIPNTY